jgi:LmbE family N-acetylglucosaminyl deacetylase
MDDEVLGCTSWLDEDVVVLYTTKTHPLTNKILEEQSLVAAKAGFDFAWTYFNDINRLDSFSQADLIGEFELYINKFKPDTILVPAPSYNQDHRACYEAALTACRPHDANHFVKRVLVYEEPETLGAMRSAHVFKPQYFRAVDIDKKIELYRLYNSQVRAHRSLEHIRALSTVRGAQSNMSEAEAFEVARWVE